MATWLGPQFSVVQLRLTLIFLLIHKNFLHARTDGVNYGDPTVTFQLSSDRDTADKLLQALQDAPEVVSYVSEYSGEDSSCKECWWEVKVNKDAKQDFVSSLSQQGFVAKLIDDKDQPDSDAFLDSGETDHYGNDEDSDVGAAYNMFASALSKLVDDIQGSVGQLKGRMLVPWKCFWLSSFFTCLILWIAAVTILFSRAKFGKKEVYDKLVGGGVNAGALTDVDVDDECDSPQPSWTTPPIYRGSGVQQGRQHLRAHEREHHPSHGSSKPSNLLSRTDVEYYDVEGMLDDVPYYEPRLSGRRL